MKNTPRTAASIAVTPLSQAKGPPPNRGVRQPLHDVQQREELARLLPLWPKELEDLSIAGRRHIIHTLDRALRAERRRGRAGHWAYDLSRHAALLATWRLECAALRDLEKSKRSSPEKNRRMAGVPSSDHERSLPGWRSPISRAAFQGPSSWQVASVPAHNSARPSDNRAAGPTSRDILPATYRSGCAGGASET
jgi:hypothetical protein